MEQKLAYSLHLGSDKNKSKLAKKVAKENLSGTTSLANNAIQNAKDLSDVNKHNLRDYDNQKELIITIYGTNDIVNDVKQVYLNEFEQARLEYNNKQNREDRKIEDYFKKVCESQNDIACEFIIELGDMDFWNDKNERYRFKMVDVYNEQIKDLSIITRLYDGDTKAFEDLLEEYKSKAIGDEKEYYESHINWLLERFPEHKYRDVIGLCKVAKLEGEDGIKDQDYSLNAGRYVGVVIEDDGMTADEFKAEMQRLHSEFEALSAQAKDLEKEIGDNLKSL